MVTITDGLEQEGESFGPVPLSVPFFDVLDLMEALRASLKSGRRSEVSAAILRVNSWIACRAFRTNRLGW
jgi:hypothetical protein